MTTNTLIRPRALRKGDRVGLIAPGWRPYKPSVVSRAAKLIEAVGCIPVIADNVLEVHGHSAGSVYKRVDDLNKFLNDDSISAIFCISGGFGGLALLADLDYGALVKQPKIILGSGENTTLLLAINKSCNLVTFHGPNLEEIRTEQSFLSLKTAVTTKTVLPPISAATGSGVWDQHHSHVAVQGKASGPLLGGNLTGITSLFGTPFEPNLRNAILFVTDQDERNDILERWLTTLWVSGQLAEVRALLFGMFDNCGNKDSLNLLSLEDCLGERAVSLGIPSIFDFPIAGGDASVTVPIGVDVSFDTKAAQLEFCSAALN